MGEIFSERSERSGDGDLISVTINSGVVKFEDLDRKDNSSEDKSNYKVVKIGDIAYNSMRMWQGASGYSPYNGILSPAYTVIVPNSGYYSKFFAFDFKRFDRIQVFKSNSQGLTSDTWNLKYPALSLIKVLSPGMEEQIAIADFLTKFDTLISLHQRKLDNVKMLKKSLLQKLFPKDGEKIPELRFPGFTDDWEQRKLGEMSEKMEYGLNAPAMEYDGTNKYLRITDIDEETREFTKTNLTSPRINLSESAQYLLVRKDILFARTGASVGKTYCYREEDGDVYFAGFLIRARIKETFDEEFIFQYTLTKMYSEYINVTSQRSGQPGVNANEYSNLPILTPDLSEQEKIGLMLRKFDSLISLHQRQSNFIKNILSILERRSLYGARK